MKEILEKICTIKGLSGSSLSNKLGSSRGFVNSVNYKKEDQLLYKLITLFPDLNPYWLITGKGSELIDIKGNSKIERLGRQQADWQKLYDQLRKMYDDKITENRHLEAVNLKLMKQIENLLNKDK